jgi:hypothetical protein
MDTEAELFIEVAEIWNLDKLYADLARAKQLNAAKLAKLTMIEQTILRGLLAEYPPKEIASKLYWTPSALSVELSRGLYRYIEVMVDRPINSLKNWREVANWLAMAGYKQGELQSVSNKNNKKIDIRNIPEINNFYGREKELEKLESWMIREQYRLVVLFGIAGIGKTALAAKLSRNLAAKFDRTIWLNLSHAPRLTDLLTELLGYFETNNVATEIRSVWEKLSCLMGYLKQQSCSIILNNYEAVLANDSLTGFYQEEYTNYSQLLKIVTEDNHNSCLLINSQYEPIDISILRNEKVDSLHLGSLGEAAKLLLQEQGLSAEQYYQELINRYYGNPLALKLVAHTVKDLFAGDLESFLDRQTEFGVIVPNFFRSLLSDLFKSLSLLEKAIMNCLTESRSPLTLDAIKTNIPQEVYLSDLIEALTKLKRYSLVEAITQEGKTVFTIQPMIGKYLLREMREKMPRSTS